MNLVEKALASTVLTAAVAFGGAAQAQQAPAPQASACTTLGQQKGVFEYPASRKAFQQEGSLACVFGYGAGGQFIPLNSYNLSDARQANAYNRELSQAERMEDNMARRNQQQADREARQNNPARRIQEGVNDVNSIRNSVNSVINIFKR